ncbi:MAG: hypothetical protein ACI4QE_02750 [Acutalibacteraceae bacterium]
MKKYRIIYSVVTKEEYKKNERNNEVIKEVIAEKEAEAIEKAIECEYLALSEEVPCLRTASEIHIFADDLSFETEMIICDFRAENIKEE